MASMVDTFTNESKDFRPYTGEDRFGQPSHGPVERIKVREERRQKWVRSADGVEIVASTYILTGRRVNTRDEFRDASTDTWAMVQAVEDVKDEGGKLLGTECYL